MANPYSMFKTDATAETETGVILDYGDFRIRVKRAGGANKKYINLLNARMKPYERQIKAETMDDDVARRIVAECYAETIVLGCDVKVKEDEYKEGILNAEGEILPDNKQNRVDFFMNLPELFRDVQAQANNFALFRSAALEDEIKN